MLQSDFKTSNLYLDGIISSVVYKDVIQKNNITNKLLLDSILQYIFDSAGSKISTKKISDTLTSKNVKTTNHTVENYISAFLESFLIYKAERYDIKGKQLLAREYKYYVADTGLKNHVLGKKANSNLGHTLENIVYLELLRRGYTVYTGKVDELEVDFVAKNKEGITYFQVAYTTLDETTLKRELKSLEKTGDHYPKILLTLDFSPDVDYDGIKKINVIDWLLTK